MGAGGSARARYGRWAALVGCGLVLALVGLCVSRARAAAPAWTRLGDAGGGLVEALALDPAEANRLYVGTYDRGLWVTRDSGQTWSNPFTRSVAALGVHPQSPATVYAGTWRGGAYRSLDHGATWAPINNGLAADHVYALLVRPGGMPEGVGVLPYAPTATGTPRTGVLPYAPTAPGAPRMSVLPYAPTATGTPRTGVLPYAPTAMLYAGTEMGLFASADGGEHWQGASVGLTGRTVYALAASGGTLLAGSDMGVFRSTDGAAHWAPANQGLAANEAYALALTGTVAYAGTERGLFRSADAGESWRAVGAGLPAAPVAGVALALGRGDIVFVATPLGVWGSANGGARWVDLTTELGGAARSVKSLAVRGAGPPWTLIIGTGDGVWQRTVAEEDLLRRVHLPQVWKQYPVGR